MPKKAFITGTTGQDGSYLSELLLEKGYEVHGVMRRSSSFNTKRVDHLIDSPLFNNTFFLHFGDVTDPSNLDALMSKIKPDEVYNLAAQSHVKVSFEIPNYTGQVDALGTLNVLESVRTNCPNAKIYQASTSELYGGLGYNMPEGGYTEESPFHPRSPYGCAKIYGYWITKNYREAYNMFACNGILFNHEGPRRGDTFVTKKITNWMRSNIQDIKNAKKLKPLELGNLNSYRDWGHAKDYVNAMYLILQQDKPDDYVISTGEAYSVKQFVEECLKYYGEKIIWVGEKENEKGYSSNGQLIVVVNPKYFRPSEVPYLLGNSTKAKTKLNWVPQYNFSGLVSDMLENT
jgi:GDPmannose 4,6-dehydratase